MYSSGVCKLLRKLVSLVVVIPTALMWISPSQAAVVAGSKCAKAGLTSTFSGKKFTCIKSGKVLIWKTGVVTVKTIPTTKSSPEPIKVVPKPSPTPSPALGSFALPVPMGTTLKDGDLTYTLNSVKFNLDSVICTANGFKDGCTFDSNLNSIVDPKSSISWIAVSFTVRNSSEEIKNPEGFGTQFNLVLPGGTLLPSNDVSGYDPLLSNIRIIPGGTGTGDVLFEVPKTINSLKSLLVLRDFSDFSNQHDYYFQINW